MRAERGRTRHWRLLTAGFLVLALTVAAGCADADGDGRTPRATTRTLTGTSGPWATGGKDQPPVEVALSFDTARFRVGDEVDFVVRFTSLQEAPRTRARIESSGIVAVDGRHEFTWDRLPGNETRTAESSFRLERQGEGKLRAVVDVLDQAGAVRYGRATEAYFLTHRGEVLTGSTSPTALRLKALERDWKAGLIDRRGYEEQHERILGGGATETG